LRDRRPQPADARCTAFGNKERLLADVFSDELAADGTDRCRFPIRSFEELELPGKDRSVLCL
jgi:hypothetical protein